MKIKNTWITLAAIGTLPVAYAQTNPTDTRQPTTLGDAAEEAAESEALDTNVERDDIQPTDTRQPQTLGSSADADAVSDFARPSEDQTIAQQVAGSEKLSTLEQAIEAAELGETLTGEGPFTVFAPTDEAFEALPEGKLEELLQAENQDQLRSLLLSHVIKGKIAAAEISSGEVATLSGKSVRVTAEGQTVTVGEATVTDPDITASNGVIHVIDSVLMPES